MKKWRKLWVWVLEVGFMLMVLLAAKTNFVYAAPETYGRDDIRQTQNELLSETDWSDMEEFLKQEVRTASTFSFQDFVSDLISGNTQKIQGQIRILLKDVFISEISHATGLVGQIMAFGILGAVFAGISGIFPGGHISETGIFMTNLLMSVALAAAFQDGVSVAGETLRKQLEFMKVAIPAYSIAVAWAGCGTTAVAWMELLLFLLSCVDWLYLNVLLPLTRIYILLVIVGGLVKEDVLSKMTELLKDIIGWATRSPIGVVLGFQIVQGMVLPFADSVKAAGMQKLLGVIPGIGSGVGAVAKVVLGSGVVIKNAVGAAVVLILVIMSLAPVIKLLVFMGLYRVAAAVLQPVADKRMVQAISGMASGQKLLVGIVAYGVVVFALAVALICLGTNAAYLA